MKKAFIGLLACGVIGGSYGGAASLATAASPTPETTITFVAHQVSDRNFNLGRRTGIAVGAVELSADNLIQGTRKVGHDGVSCTITRLSGGSADSLCNIVFALRGGRIATVGLITSTPSGPGTVNLAVVGGTGIYSTARGDATVQQQTGNAAAVTLHLAG